MADPKLTARIAEGLFEVSRERNATAAYREDLKFFDWILSKDGDLVAFLSSPFQSYEEKVAVVVDLFGDLLLPGVMTFVKLLIRDGEIPLFSAVKKDFDKLADERINIAEGILYTPYELDVPTLTRLERALRRRIGKNVALRQIIDKSLIAGVRVLLDGTSYELSIENRLSNIQKSLEMKIS